MRKYSLFVAVLLPLSLAAQFSKGSFQLTGDVSKLSTSPVSIVSVYSFNGEQKRDTLSVKNGKYSLRGEAAEPVFINLRALYQNTAPDQAPRAADIALVVTQAGKVTVTSTDSFSNVTVTGSTAHQEFRKLQSGEDAFKPQFQQLIQQYMDQQKAGDIAGRDRTEKQLDSVQHLVDEQVYGAYLKQNPSSPLSMYALRKYAGAEIDPAKIQPIYNSLPAALRATYSGKMMADRIEIAKKTAVGQVAPDFEQADTLGKPVRLSAFRGKYLLVDFWASWCGPCRRENPNVVKAYDSYKGKGFYVLGVSLDRPGAKDKWVQAIHADGLEWAHVSDLKFWDNAVAKQYGIQSIPQNLLLDPGGKIIAKNLRGEALQQKLSEILGNN